MVNRIIYRDYAMDYCHLNGYKLFIDLCIKDNVIIIERPKELSTEITEAGKYGIHEDTVIKVMDGIIKAGYKIVPK